VIVFEATEDVVELGVDLDELATRPMATAATTTMPTTAIHHLFLPFMTTTLR
jgi:hypothetical protein